MNKILSKKEHISLKKETEKLKEGILQIIKKIKKKRRKIIK